MFLRSKSLTHSSFDICNNNIDNDSSTSDINSNQEKDTSTTDENKKDALPKSNLEKVSSQEKWIQEEEMEENYPFGNNNNYSPSSSETEDEGRFEMEEESR